MKQALKYTLAALAASAVAAPAFAGHTSNILSNLAVSGTVTYSEVNSDGNHFADQLLATNAFRPSYVEHDYETDYGVGLTYRIGNSNTRLYVEYDHFDSNDNRQVQNYASLARAATIVNVTDAVSEIETDSLKFGFRHTLDFGHHFDLDLGAGLEYANLERRLNIRRVEANGTQVFQAERYNETEGFGAYMDAKGRAFPFGGKYHCWSLFGQAGVGLLFADVRDFYKTTDNNGAPVSGWFDAESRDSTIAKLDASMGVEFNRVMHSDLGGVHVSVKGGVQFTNYINAFQNGALFQSTGANGVGNGSTNTSSDDFSRFGPFLTLTVGGANS